MLLHENINKFVFVKAMNRAACSEDYVVNYSDAKRRENIYEPARQQNICVGRGGTIAEVVVRDDDSSGFDAEGDIDDLAQIQVNFIEVAGSRSLL